MDPRLLECRTSYIDAAYYSGTLPEATVIVIHSAETPELQQSAEGVARYFASGNVRASTHLTTDEDSIVQSVPLDRVCWGTGEDHANAWTWQIEQAGYASQDRSQWLDVYSKATITNTAVACRELIARNPKIRPIRLGPDQLLAGERYGITSHGDIHAAWPQGDGRTDPGPEYPWDVLLDMVANEPTDSDFARFLAMLAELEEEMAKAHLARAQNSSDVYTVDGATRTKKLVTDDIAIGDLQAHGMVAPKASALIQSDPNGVEVWPQRVLDHFTTVAN